MDGRLRPGPGETKILLLWGVLRKANESWKGLAKTICARRIVAQATRICEQVEMPNSKPSSRSTFFLNVIKSKDS